jgi:putative SOS response-associated peptidase YedK
MFKSNPMILNYSCAVSRDTVQSLDNRLKISSNYRTSYNVHPGQTGWVLTTLFPEKVSAAMWGFPDAWDNDGKRITSYMAEGSAVATSSTFRLPIRQHRCLVVADSYYVVIKRGDKKLVHRVFSRDFPCILLAGVIEKRIIQDREVKCFAVLQTEANADVKDLYHKMPLIMNYEEGVEWISNETPIKGVLEAIRPLSRYSLQYYQVTNQLLSTGFDSSEAHSRKLEQITLFD